jgi:small subunit ribosomal protein S18
MVSPLRFVRLANTDKGSASPSSEPSKGLAQLVSRIVPQTQSLNRGYTKEDERRRSSEDIARAEQMERFLTRRWKDGEVYAPHDLSASEMKKWARRNRPNQDAFDLLALDPLSLYKVCDALDIFDELY